MLHPTRVNGLVLINASAASGTQSFFEKMVGLKVSTNSCILINIEEVYFLNFNSITENFHFVIRRIKLYNGVELICIILEQTNGISFMHK